jgi:triacylglycerol lipase
MAADVDMAPDHSIRAGLRELHRPWLEVGALLRHPVWRGADVAPGDGLPVLLIPGFLAGDPSLTLMRRWLRRHGYWTCTSQIRFNVDCTRAAVARLERRLQRLTERHGRPAAIVGQSRGGTLAKLVALRRPELVSGIVALGSPNVDPMAINPMVARQVGLVAALGTAGVRGLFGHDCLHGDCAEEVRDWLSRPFPEGVAYCAVYSRRDGVVDWRACLDPDAEHVEVDSTHVGMSVHAGVYAVLAERLAALAVGTAGYPTVVGGGAGGVGEPDAGLRGAPRRSWSEAGAPGDAGAIASPNSGR